MKKFLAILLLGFGTGTVRAQPALPGFSMSRTQNLNWPRWKQGKRGAKVQALQMLLNARGGRLRVDGDFSSATTQAVQQFQSKNGLVVDGVVGAQTWERLIIPLRRGNRGTAVRAFRLLLSQSGYRTGDADTFDWSLENAVRRYQRKEGEGLMISNGRASLWVWCWLLGGSNISD